MKRRSISAIVAAVCLGSSSANAYQVFEGRVDVLQPSYLPTVVSFTMTAGSSLCPAGNWLKWQNANTDNNKAVYATLLAAFTASKSVRLYINDGDTTCTGVLMHVFQ
jgi:hypothetical protein